MKELLYIDGQAVDLGGKVDITLNYKSNLLTDLGKIVGNNSYTIKLPKTKRNLGIIGISDIPSVVTTFPRKYHEARYFRNGVEIVSDGRVVLLAVSDTIEVVLTWGNTNGFFKMIDDGRNINEFPNVDDYVLWNLNNSKSVYNGTDEVLNVDINFGLAPGEDMAAIHPSVRSTYIFGLIQSYYRINIEFPEDRKSFVDSLVIPLLTRNAGYANLARTRGSVNYNELTGGYVLIRMGDEFDKNFIKVDMGGSHFQFFEVLVDGKVTVHPTFFSQYPDLAIQYGPGALNELTVEYLPYRIERRDNIDYDIYVYDTAVEVDLVAGEKFGFNLWHAKPNGINNAYFQMEIAQSQINLGDKFPIVENLPPIKCVDFIKAVASISGLFVVPSSDLNTIKFISFDRLYETDALDWSDRVVRPDYENRPESISYSLDGFARKNRMLWHEDESVGITTANGNIFVDDATLDYERDAVSLPFAASDTRSGKALIRLYDYPNPVSIYDKGEPELQSLEPRILIEKDIGGYSTGTFDGLHWSVLLRQYYNTYQNAVKSPVVITERIMLDDITIRELDVSTPVYLRQYGKYYAIIEVKVPSEGACECKLLQLD